MGIYPPTSLGTPIPGLLPSLAPERLILAREDQRRNPLLVRALAVRLGGELLATPQAVELRIINAATRHSLSKTDQTRASLSHNDSLRFAAPMHLPRLRNPG